MLIYKKLCKVCKTCREDKKLLNRIYNSTSLLGRLGVEGVTAIQRDYVGKFSLQGLKNHVRDHQFIDSSAYNSALQRKADKNAEQKAIRKLVNSQDAIQSVIDKGFDRLEEGEITVDTNQLIRASQVKIQAEGKQKDQELKLIETIAFFAAGSMPERIYREAEISETP